jgi:RNA polymerase II subunit A C-terminal domain phosphatase SSU72
MLTLICRSMEAHLQLAKAHYPVISFGTGSLVRLPGPTITQPNVYQFNKTSYDSIYKELEAKDPRLYKANGLLNMIGRNRGVKWGPERWQDWQVGMPRLDHVKDMGYAGTEGGLVDVVITCEERCWDAVIDDLLNRGSPLNRPVHVINVDIKDNHEEAAVGGRGILDLANSLNTAAQEEREKAGFVNFDSGSAPARGGFDERVPEILGAWQERWPNLPATWTLAWF